MQHKTPQARRRRHVPWTPGVGTVVELWKQGAILRKGKVETVMPDGSGFWLGREGLEPRCYVRIDDDSQEIWS